MSGVNVNSKYRLGAAVIALFFSIVVAHADLWRDCSTLAQLGRNERQSTAPKTL